MALSVEQIKLEPIKQPTEEDIRGLLARWSQFRCGLEKGKGQEFQRSYFLTLTDLLDSPFGQRKSLKLLRANKLAWHKQENIVVQPLRQQIESPQVTALVSRLFWTCETLTTLSLICSDRKQTVDYLAGGMGITTEALAILGQYSISERVRRVLAHRFAQNLNDRLIPWLSGSEEGISG